MIHIVQVIPYTSNNGCSVRIGKGYDVNERLDECQCEYYEFVESEDEVKSAINIIKKLPEYYRNRDISIAQLKKFNELYKDAQNNDGKYKWNDFKKIIKNEFKFLNLFN